MAEFTELDHQRIEIVKKLFAAWSSGNADAQTGERGRATPGHHGGQVTGSNIRAL